MLGWFHCVQYSSDGDFNSSIHGRHKYSSLQDPTCCLAWLVTSSSRGGDRQFMKIECLPRMRRGKGSSGHLTPIICPLENKIMVAHFYSNWQRNVQRMFSCSVNLEMTSSNSNYMEMISYNSNIFFFSSIIVFLTINMFITCSNFMVLCIQSLIE